VSAPSERTGNKQFPPSGTKPAPLERPQTSCGRSLNTHVCADLLVKCADTTRPTPDLRQTFDHHVLEINLAFRVMRLESERTLVESSFKIL